MVLFTHYLFVPAKKKDEEENCFVKWSLNVEIELKDDFKNSNTYLMICFDESTMAVAIFKVGGWLTVSALANRWLVGRTFSISRAVGNVCI